MAGGSNIEVTGNLIYHMPRPLMFNNHNQNRRASCPVHDNMHTPPAIADGIKGHALKGGAAVDEVKVNQIADQAGLEPAYRDLLEQK